MAVGEVAGLDPSVVYVRAATPDPPALSLALSVTVAAAVFHPAALGAGATEAVVVGAVLSLRKVSAGEVVEVLPATSEAVIVSRGDEVVPAVHLNRPEGYGPPAGVDTADAVCVQPAFGPARAEVALEAGPDPPASDTLFVSRSEPAALPR
jgi:hypothetical protein